MILNKLSDKHLNTYEDRPYDPEIYNEAYFEGKAGYGYESYLQAYGVLNALVDLVKPSIENRIPKLYSTIDVGGAYGHVANIMSKMGATAWNFELSEWAVERCNELYPHVVTVQGDATVKRDWMVVPQDTFDLVTAFEFFEHVPTESIDSVLTQMALCAKWGIFLTQSRSWADIDRDAVRGDHGHLHYHSNLFWLNKLDTYGDIDFDSMTDMNYRAFQMKDLAWGNRLYMVRFHDNN